MDNKKKFFMDLIKLTDDNCLLRITDYVGFLERDFIEKHFRHYKFMENLFLEFPLNPDNKKAFIKVLDKFNFIFFQEAFITCNEKLIFEAYDNLNVGIFHSKSIPLDIEAYVKKGLNIGFAKKDN